MHIALHKPARETKHDGFHQTSVLPLLQLYLKGREWWFVMAKAGYLGRYTNNRHELEALRSSGASADYGCFSYAYSHSTGFLNLLFSPFTDTRRHVSNNHRGLHIRPCMMIMQSARGVTIVQVDACTQGKQPSDRLACIFKISCFQVRILVELPHTRNPFIY